jgi:hypothetical protein
VFTAPLAIARRTSLTHSAIADEFRSRPLRAPRSQLAVVSSKKKSVDHANALACRLAAELEAPQEGKQRSD